MSATLFRSGPKRQVCVNRNAIQHNLKHGTNFPTVIVVENGIWHEFHEVQQRGCISFDTSRTDLPAKVFIETDAEIVGMTNLKTKNQSFLHLKPRKMPLRERLARFLGFFGIIPLVSCFVPIHYQKLYNSEPAYDDGTVARPYYPKGTPVVAARPAPTGC